jgi:hypothetical protein
MEMGKVEQGSGMAGVKYGQERAADRKGNDKHLFEIVIEDVLLVACNDQFILVVLLIGIISGLLLVRMTGIKENEGVAWRGIRNQSLQLTNHINASRVGKIWEVGIVSHHSNVFRSITIGVGEELLKAIYIIVRTIQG